MLFRHSCSNANKSVGLLADVLVTWYFVLRQDQIQSVKLTVHWNCNAVQIFTLFRLTFGYFIKVKPINRKIDTENLNSFSQNSCLNYYITSMETVGNTATPQPEGTVNTNNFAKIQFADIRSQYSIFFLWRNNVRIS